MEGVGEFSDHQVGLGLFSLFFDENLKSCRVCANAQLKKMLEAMGKLIPAQFQL